MKFSFLVGILPLSLSPMLEVSFPTVGTKKDEFQNVGCGNILKRNQCQVFHVPSQQKHLWRDNKMMLQIPADRQESKF